MTETSEAAEPLATAPKIDKAISDAARPTLLPKRHTEAESPIGAKQRSQQSPSIEAAMENPRLPSVSRMT